MVFIEYEAKDTMVHRLNPLSKLIWFSSLVFLLTLYLEPQPLLIIFLLELFIGYLAKVPWRKLMARAWWAFILSIFGGYTFSLWVNKPSQFWHIPPELGCKVLLELTPPETPLLGYTAITYGGLLWGTAITLKVFLGVIAASILTYTIPLSDVVYLWSKVLPYRLSFICVTGIRFYPVMMEKVREIIIAAKSRGWEIRSKNPITRAKEAFPIVLPSAREAMLLAERMALAIEARAFGVKKPTSLRKFTFNSADVFFIIFNVSITVALTCMWWYYGFGKL